MKTTRELIAAPTGMQPGGYVREAYADRNQPKTPSVDVEVSQRSGVWSVTVQWSCPDPVREVRSDPSRFSDATALLAPSVAGAPWVTMGAPGLGVDGVLWRADGDALLRVSAEGLGTVKRVPAPQGWSAVAAWEAKRWRVAFELKGWESLAQLRQLAVAVWRGADAERGGLKSITPGWIEVTT
jgi:DMSO reductase family type II enzyme heme b subunit